MRTSADLNVSGIIARGTFLALIALSAAAPVHAVDGVIEINQAKVEAGSGFPFVISQPGSYRLTGNLTVDQNTTAIRIMTDNVTVDLNGFAIIGPTVCGGSPPVTPIECMPLGSGNGIVADPNTTTSTILNGTVRGMGSGGVSVVGHSRIEGVHAINNGGAGIEASVGSVASGNTANSNGIGGIALGFGCTVTGNTANNNAGFGISAREGSTVIGNTMRGNQGVGLNLPGGSASGYATNVLSGNNNGGAQVSGGLQMGTNICNGATCP